MRRSLADVRIDDDDVDDKNDGEANTGLDREAFLGAVPVADGPTSQDVS